jgi:hypothetical protein
MVPVQRHNARIIATMLGLEGNGLMTFVLSVEYKGGGVAFGGYVLDTYDEKLKKRAGTAVGIDCIREIMDTVGVEKWEDLRGSHVVVETFENKATGIRNILDDDKWFYPQQWFEERLPNVSKED